MRKTAILALLPAALALAGCSVWEDRSGCPGWLYLELSARSLAVAGDYPTRVSIFHGGLKDTLLLSKDSPSDWIQVKKGTVQLRGILRNGASDLQAWGGECDSLWAYSAELTMQAEERSATVTLHKRFATIWFSFDDAPDAEQYRMVIRSPGEFRCLLDASGGEASARLPAIGDESLELCCLSSDTGGTLWEWVVETMSNPMVVSEFERQSYAMSADLPEMADLGSLSAKLENGMLNVTIKKRPETQPKKIDIL